MLRKRKVSPDESSVRQTRSSEVELLTLFLGVRVHVRRQSTGSSKLGVAERAGVFPQREIPRQLTLQSSPLAILAVGAAWYIVW